MMEIVEAFLGLAPEAKFGFSAFLLALLLLVLTQVISLSLVRRRERMSILTDIQLELRRLGGAPTPEFGRLGRPMPVVAASRPVRRVQLAKRTGAAAPSRSPSLGNLGSKRNA